MATNKIKQRVEKSTTSKNLKKEVQPKAIAPMKPSKKILPQTTSEKIAAAPVTVLRKRIGLTSLQFARLIPVSQRTMVEIEKGVYKSETARRSINHLTRMIKALEEVVRFDAIGTWLENPNPAFDGLKPREVIERGEYDRLWEMIYNLKAGGGF